MAYYKRTDRPTAAELLELPVLFQSHAGNLHYENRGLQFWLSRCGLADGEPYENTVTIEVRDDSEWRHLYSYDGGTV